MRQRNTLEDAKEKSKKTIKSRNEPDKNNVN